jgi:hypothetical protein
MSDRGFITDKGITGHSRKIYEETRTSNTTNWDIPINTLNSKFENYYIVETVIKCGSVSQCDYFLRYNNTENIEVSSYQVWLTNSSGVFTTSHAVGPGTPSGYADPGNYIYMHFNIGDNKGDGIRDYQATFYSSFDTAWDLELNQVNHTSGYITTPAVGTDIISLGISGNQSNGIGTDSIIRIFTEGETI